MKFAGSQPSASQIIKILQYFEAQKLLMIEIKKLPTFLKSDINAKLLFLAQPSNQIKVVLFVCLLAKTMTQDCIYQ